MNLVAIVLVNSGIALVASCLLIVALTTPFKSFWSRYRFTPQIPFVRQAFSAHEWSDLEYQDRATHLKNSFHATLIWIAISDLFLALSWSLTAVYMRDNSWFCGMQAFGIELFTLSSGFFTACVAWELYRGLCAFQEEVQNDYSGQRHGRYILVSWTVAILITIFAAAGGSFGPFGGPWCWLQNKYHHSVSIFIAYLPLAITLALIIALYLQILIHTYRAFSNRTNRGELARDEANIAWRKLLKLGLYPIVFVLLWLPSSINRISYYGESEETARSAGVPLVTALTSPAQGTLNVFVYAFVNKQIRRNILNIIKKVFMSIRALCVQRKHNTSTHFSTSTTLDSRLLENRQEIDMSKLGNSPLNDKEYTETNEDDGSQRMDHQQRISRNDNTYTRSPSIPDQYKQSAHSKSSISIRESNLTHQRHEPDQNQELQEFKRDTSNSNTNQTVGNLLPTKENSNLSIHYNTTDTNHHPSFDEDGTDDLGHAL